MQNRRNVDEIGGGHDLYDGEGASNQVETGDVRRRRSSFTYQPSVWLGRRLLPLRGRSCITRDLRLCVYVLTSVNAALGDGFKFQFPLPVIIERDGKLHVQGHPHIGVDAIETEAYMKGREEQWIVFSVVLHHRIPYDPWFTRFKRESTPSISMACWGNPGCNRAGCGYRCLCFPRTPLNDLWQPPLNHPLRNLDPR